MFETLGTSVIDQTSTLLKKGVTPRVVTAHQRVLDRNPYSEAQNFASLIRNPVKMIAMSIPTNQMSMTTRTTYITRFSGVSRRGIRTINRQ